MAWTLSQIVTALNADGRLELFALVADNGDVYHKWQLESGGPNWSGWFSLGATKLQRIAPAINLDGSIELFAIGGDSNIYHIAQTKPNGIWGGWSKIPATDLADLAVSRNADGRLELFTLGRTSGGVWHTWQQAPGGTWSPWSGLGGTGLRAIRVAANLDGRLELFALGGDRRLWHVWQLTANGGWGGWLTLQGVDLQQLEVERNLDGRLEVFALGGDRAVYNLWQESPGGAWSTWSPLGGQELRGIATGRDADGRLEVFALGVVSELGGLVGIYQSWQATAGGGWVDWSLHLAPNPGWTSFTIMTVATNSDGRLEIFAVGTTNIGSDPSLQESHVFHASQVVPNGEWGDWTDLYEPTPAPPPPAKVPTAPLNVVATPGDSQASVSWQAPASDGGSTITGFSVTVYDSGTGKTVYSQPVGLLQAVQMASLVNGRSYFFGVTARNAVGSGPEARSNIVSPVGIQKQGFGGVAIFNCSDEKDTLSVWYQDHTTGGGWVSAGSLDQQYDDFGTCPAQGAIPVVINFTTNHIYEITALDPTLVNCSGDDPSDNNCWRHRGFYLGLSGGPVDQWIVS